VESAVCNDKYGEAYNSQEITEKSASREELGIISAEAIGVEANDWMTEHIQVLGLI
jgi:hypothetical protein